MKKIKICFPFEGNNLGGSHYSTLELINNLNQNKFKPIIVIHKKGYLYKYLINEKCKLKYLPINKFVGEKKGFFFNIFCILNLIFPIRNFIKSHDIDIVHGNDARINLSWVIPSKLSFVKFIWHQRLKFASKWNLYKYLSCFSDKIICVSDYVLRGIPLFIKNKIVKISNPISLGKIKNDKVLKNKYFKKNEKKILFLGNIIERKKVDIFVKSAELISLKFPNAKFYVVGLDKHNILKKLLKKNKNQISNLTYIGFTDNPFLWLKNCDLLLSPAVDEALGRNIVEAMLSRIPVIAAESGGNSEIIKNNINGWLFKKDDYVQLSKKSVYILNLKKNKLNALLKRAHFYVEKRYSVSNHVKRINKVYLKI